MADHGSHYSEEAFSRKARRWARFAGREVLEKALWLFYALQKEDCPAWARAAIIGALGYFIFPLDAIPDFIPIFGFTDDLGVLAGAVATVATRIDASVKEKAAARLREWGFT